MTERPPAELVAELAATDQAARSLGIRIRSVALGAVELESVPGAHFANGHGIVHGGIVFALADTAFAYALASRGNAGVTTNADIAFLKPARAGERLIARATETHHDGVSGIYDVEICDDDGALLAAFRGHGRIPRTRTS